MERKQKKGGGAERMKLLHRLCRSFILNTFSISSPDERVLTALCPNPRSTLQGHSSLLHPRSGVNLISARVERKSHPVEE